MLPEHRTAVAAHRADDEVRSANVDTEDVFQNRLALSGKDFMKLSGHSHNVEIRHAAVVPQRAAHRSMPRARSTRESQHLHQPIMRAGGSKAEGRYRRPEDRQRRRTGRLRQVQR
jgi:hypothetical protein